ncbi:MAG: DsbA family protein [bacterium]|jgi:predicted DsbA family dithiol-disulfide isomerase|nr:DsbA family oxidoreductase [Betaproteobacteria bacterium]
MDTDTDATEPLTIEVVSDVVCPWCYIGKRRLEAALELYAKAKPDAPAPKVSFHPFQLNPDLPPEGMLRADYVARKWGGRSSAEVYARVSGVGKGVGIDFEFDRIVRQPNTKPAHVLIMLAAEQGVQPAVKEAMMRAYFIDGRDLTDIDTLVEVAERAGLDPKRARAHLADPDALRAIDGADLQARRIGVEGVPFFIFNRRYAVSGAQEAQTLLDAMIASEAPADEPPAQPA